MVSLLAEQGTVPGRVGTNPDRTCLTVVHSLLAGGDCIEGVNIARSVGGSVLPLVAGMTCSAW